MRGAKQQVALLGEDQAARMAVEQRNRQFLFECRDLARHGRLRETELLAGMREASRFGRRVKHLQLVPVHVQKSVAGSMKIHSAAARSFARSARKRSAS